MITLKNHTTTELTELLRPVTDDPRLPRLMQGLAMRHRVGELPRELTGVKRQRWQAAIEGVSIGHLELVEKCVSPTDGFAKYLFRGKDEQLFEAVRIPLLHRPGKEKYVICVSSQVGCAAKCAFCATGRMGFRRNLETWEIVDQVVKIQADSSFRVGGIVFMGMGEPLLNYDNVMRAARIFSDPCGLAIDSKAITISTVGVLPVLKRFVREKRSYRLIFSATAASKSLRNELLPMNLNYPIEAIVETLRDYAALTGKRVTLAWTMIAGVNMNREELRELKRIVGDLKIILDLIPVNDTTGMFRPPTSDELQEFLDMVREEVACPIVVRYSGGKDIQGACGMLAATKSL